MTYPFVTRRQIIARLGRDPEFARTCLTILHRRFVDRDILSPPAGWMASDVKRAEKLYKQVSAGDASAANLALATTLVQKYARQLARHFRDEELSRNPALKPLAAVYGIRPTVEDEEVDDGPDEDPFADDSASLEEEAAPVPAQPPPSAPEVVTPPRRRGRPPGSKNKPKPATTVQSHRRRRSR
jgi:hypothetical protein